MCSNSFDIFLKVICEHAAQAAESCNLRDAAVTDSSSILEAVKGFFGVRYGTVQILMKFILKYFSLLHFDEIRTFSTAMAKKI